MGAGKRGTRVRENPWCEVKTDGDAIDRFYEQELRADGYSNKRKRTIREAREAWGIFHLPWEHESHLRMLNDELAQYWLAYIYSVEIHGTTLRELMRVIDELAPTRVLDIGCGVGFDACLVAARNEQMIVRGTDLSPGMIDYAQRRATRLGLTNVQFNVAAHRDLAALFPTERFDFIWSHGSLLFIHYDDLREHMTGIANVLRPGGIFFCEMPIAVDPNRFVYHVQNFGLGLALRKEDQAGIRTLTVNGTEICWCCGFQLEL